MPEPDPEAGAGEARDDDRREADDHGDAGAEDEPREDAAPGVWGPGGVPRTAARLPHGRMEAVAERADLGIVRRDHVGEDRDQRERQEDERREEGEPLAPEGGEAPRQREPRRPAAVHRSYRIRGSITA